jgi:hypothetical protein
MIVRNCKLCTHYFHNEDENFECCYLKNDLDENEHLIAHFNRSEERDCCFLEFWKVLDADPELEKIFDNENEHRDSINIDKSYDYFCKKYLN